VTKKLSDSTHAKFKRGEGVAISKVANKALRGRLRHAERTQVSAVKAAKKVYEWLQPTEGGYLEAEGLERTRQFKQQDIVQARRLRLSLVLCTIPTGLLCTVLDIVTHAGCGGRGEALGV
jgi:hypothetical protein